MAFLSDLADILFPRRCVFCRGFLSRTETDICGNCMNSLPYTQDGGIQTGDFFTVCVSPLFYEAAVRKAVHRFKFNGKSGYARIFGTLMADCIRENLSKSYDMMTWIPLSDKRYKSRGYSQSMLLAMAVALELDDVAVALLSKPRDIPSQTTIVGGQDKRRDNVNGAYEVSEPEMAAGKKILLIDDIITTGATLSECARILLNAGASEVQCATLCRIK